MEKEIANLRVEALRAKLELSWIVAAALMHNLEYSTLTDEAKGAAFLHWQEVTQEGDLLAFALDLIRRRQRESVSHGTRKPKLRV